MRQWGERETITGTDPRPQFRVEFWIAGELSRSYVIAMTAMAAKLLEQVRKLPPTEQRELCEAILREAAGRQNQTAPRRKSIADIAGKYSPQAVEEAKDHDQGFVDAIIASKARRRAA